MALVIADRVYETSTTTGTGTYTLAGAAGTTYQAFSAVCTTNDTVYYSASDKTNGGWEIGLGTYTAAGTLLARTTILASSNANAAVNWVAGTRDVFLTDPALQISAVPAGGTTGQALTKVSGTDFNASWQTIVAPAGTLTGATLASGVTASSLTTVGTLASPVLTTPVINGTITGTGQSTAATASVIAVRDSNANLSADNFIQGYTTVATAAGTTTIAVGDVGTYFFTGTTTQTVALPVASTLVLGMTWRIVNNSTGVVTVNSSGANLVLAMPTLTQATFTCILASGTTAASWDAQNTSKTISSGGLTNFTEAVSTSAPNATVPVASFTATNAATNVDATLRPKGTGALTANVADNTATGGDKRGSNSVDWQASRSASTQVASGNYATISGGQNNTASGGTSTVGGGTSNSAIGSQATVAGGNSNTAGGSAILYPAVGGGFSNSATKDWGVVSGGRANAASQDGSAILGGRDNTASGTYASIGGGQNNTASGAHACISGGQNNTASGTQATIPGGYYADTKSIATKYAYASGFFAAIGDGQFGELIVRRATTDATATVLTALGGAASTTNQLILQNNQMMAISGVLACRKSVAQADQVAAWTFTAVISRGAAAANTAMVGTATITSLANTITSLGATPFTLTADTTNGGLKVEVTGVAAINLRWVCRLSTVEIIYA